MHTQITDTRARRKPEKKTTPDFGAGIRYEFIGDRFGVCSTLLGAWGPTFATCLPKLLRRALRIVCGYTYVDLRDRFSESPHTFAKMCAK